jgi:hypothetical protein
MDSRHVNVVSYEFGTTMDLVKASSACGQRAWKTTLLNVLL